tara:strand:- start:518 stop:691 length:174 start_codon:yes stop_codon:yes gene_type:complete
MNNEECITTIKTSDGYKFYLLKNGRVVDNLNADLVDMSCESFGEFLTNFEISTLIEA